MYQAIQGFLRAIATYHWWQIAIELLVIATAVYFVLRSLEGTRGARLLRGVALVLISFSVIVSVLVNLLQLAGLKFLYERVLNFAFFAVIVVFQPELRRALLRLGETRWFRGFSSDLQSEINELVEAAQFLSKRKIGALIAVERETGLGGIAESGTKINADLSASLLNTIFWPNSPLHDMGVIVSQGRVMYAGAQFPLADANDMEKELGTRHRAAVGLSEEYDSVVLVVSEETGDISIAENGQLIRKLTTEGLKGLLSELLSGSERRARARKRRQRLAAAV